LYVYDRSPKTAFAKRRNPITREKPVPEKSVIKFILSSAEACIENFRIKSNNSNIAMSFLDEEG